MDKYSLQFGVPEFDSPFLRSGILLKLLFLWHRTHLLHISVFVTHLLLLLLLITCLSFLLHIL
jgi:hypothetical protein